MKVIVFCVVLVAFLAIVEARKKCRSNEECDEDECCIARRILGFLKGNCKKLAAKGESCSEEDESLGFLDHKYVEHCPCVSGLSCEPTEIKSLPFIGTVRIDERCVEGEQTTPTEPKPETQTEPEPVTQTEPEPQTQTEPEPKTETEPEPEPETKTEPEPEPKTEVPPQK
ncbi:uncharacterized protein CDAR_78751 [Caerostris darwini]|uniref:Uncharacterized protein n=1 Tax=Caerostris darwini TaxID=1538125 RepID=A0AAV4UWA3_9ARAC|nr:uncharacterized protein CDAR_78751 [Caerostris darwini]